MKKAAALEVLCVILALELSVLLPSPLVSAWIPEPYELYGVARDDAGIVLVDGSPIRTFIDGVDYSNKSSVFSRPGFFDGYFNVDTYGNAMTNRIDPGTLWIKEGGDDGDDIMYSWGDMSNNTPLGGISQPWKGGVVFRENHTWQTGLPPVAGDLNAAPDALQPPLVKIFKIVTNSTLSPFTDNVWLCNPTPYPLEASEFFIEKDVPGSFSGPVVQLPTGTIKPFSRYYVDTASQDYFVETGDAVKLVWKNNGSNPQAPFGGKDVVLDRVEFNSTVGGTLNWEPGNTIQRNEPAPPRGFQINRSDSCHDTNSMQQDFFLVPEVFEDLTKPSAPWPMSIAGLSSDSIDARMYHLTRLSGFLLNWTYHDLESPQWKASVAISQGPNRANILWINEVMGTAQSTTYSGLPLQPCSDYWYSVMTNDGYRYGDLADLGFHTNCLPIGFQRLGPLNGATTAEGSKFLWWTNATDGDPGDSINYTWRVSTSPTMTPLFDTGTTSSNHSDAFTVTAPITYYWCVNASDGWQWVDGCSIIWQFTAGSTPPAPWGDQLMLDGHASADPWLQRVTDRLPMFTWRFNPATRSQTAFDIRVLRKSDDFVMWHFNNTGIGGDQSLATYGSGGTALQLVNGSCYYFRVAVRDDLTPQLWGDSGEQLDFCINTPPPVPTPLAPSDDSVRFPGAAFVFWENVTDLDAGDTVTYEYCVDTSDPPYPACGVARSASIANSSSSFTTVDGRDYSWAVRAYDQHEYSDWSDVWNFTARKLSIPPPVAKAIGSSEAFVGDTVSFFGYESHGHITRYNWTIKDANGAVVAGLTGVIVSFVFNEPGTYNVTLTVFDDQTGLSSSDTLFVIVKIVNVEGFNLWWIAILFVALLLGGIFGGTEAGRVVLLTLLVAPMHGRKSKDKEDVETRGMIRGYIVGNPGDCYTSIKRNLGLNNGTASWHLMKLEKEGLVKSKVQGTRRRYYPKGAAIPAENGGELHEIEKKLIEAVKTDSGRSVKELADELRVSSQLALYHLRRLNQKGLLTLERRGFRLRVSVPDSKET